MKIHLFIFYKEQINNLLFLLIYVNENKTYDDPYDIHRIQDFIFGIFQCINEL